MNAQTRVSGTAKSADMVAPEPDIARVLADPNEKDFQDFRDRAAYVHATGSFPTHLRSYMTALLRKATRYSRQPVSLDGRVGSLKVVDENIQRLGLEEHPMIRKTRQFIEQGYKIQVARDPKTRRPYSKVFLYREGDSSLNARITVQADGSVKEGWA